MRQSAIPMAMAGFNVPDFVQQYIRRGALKHRVTDAQFAEYVLWHALGWSLHPRKEVDADLKAVYVIPTALFNGVTEKAGELDVSLGAFLTDAVLEMQRRKK